MNFRNQALCERAKQDGQLQYAWYLWAYVGGEKEDLAAIMPHLGGTKAESSSKRVTNKRDDGGIFRKHMLYGHVT